MTLRRPVVEVAHHSDRAIAVEGVGEGDDDLVAVEVLVDHGTELLRCVRRRTAVLLLKTGGPTVPQRTGRSRRVCTAATAAAVAARHLTTRLR